MHGGHAPLPAKTQAVARQAIDAAFAVHTTLGPGLLESVYEQCLAHELLHQGLRVERQKPLPVIYRELKLEAGFRTDIVVEGCLIIEVKAVDALAPVHTAQVLTYLKLSGLRLGYLINFNVGLLKEGLKRVIR